MFDRGAVLSARYGAAFTGQLDAADIEQLGLTGMRADLSEMAGRDVNFMIFRSLDAFARGPSIEVPKP